MSIQYRTYIAESKEKKKKKGIHDVFITTETEDRDVDIIVAAGGDFTPFLKNPVVLFGHEYREFPVARALNLEVIPGKGVKSTFQFPEWGINERADDTRRLWEAKFLNAVSIGFMPLEWELRDAEDFWGGIYFNEWELLEYSIVTVPSNRDALRLAAKSLMMEQELSSENPMVVPNIDAINQQRAQAKRVQLENLFGQMGKLLDTIKETL